jgi:hypothetical protein
MQSTIRRKPKTTAAIGTVALLALAAFAYAAVTVSFSVTAKPNRANKPTGLYVKIKSSDPGVPQPPIMTRLLIKLPGGKYNANKFRRCKLSTLQARGPKGCSKRSKIGTGNGIGMARPVVTDPVNGKLTIFNGARQGGKDTVLVFVLPDLWPTFVSVGKVIKKRGKYALDFTIPPIKTLPSAPDASVVSVNTKTPVKRVVKRREGKRKKYYLIVAPRKCRSKWKGSGTFYFANGETRTVPISQKCRKR